MEQLPEIISICFGLISITTIYLFYLASKKSYIVLCLLLLWLIVQSFLANSGFYLNTTGFPPRFLLLVLPPLLTMILFFLTAKGRAFIDSLNPVILTYLHTIRIPVEFVLYALFIYGVIPELMTFEGMNFDILAGLTAPLIAYFGYQKKSISIGWRIAWNIASIGLLLNVVVCAILSAPFPFQQLAFDQPNIAVFHFPFNLLPGVVVPLVFFSHGACIRQLINERRSL